MKLLLKSYQSYQTSWKKQRKNPVAMKLSLKLNLNLKQPSQ